MGASHQSVNALGPGTGVPPEASLALEDQASQLNAGLGSRNNREHSSTNMVKQFAQGRKRCTFRGLYETPQAAGRVFVAASG